MKAKKFEIHAAADVVIEKCLSNATKAVGSHVIILEALVLVNGG
jgi:hypothetical protein